MVQWVLAGEGNCGSVMGTGADRCEARIDAEAVVWCGRRRWKGTADLMWYWCGGERLKWYTRHCCQYKTYCSTACVVAKASNQVHIWSCETFESSSESL